MKMSAGESRKRGAADPSSGSSKKLKVLSVTTESIQDVLERLNCPICFELPKAEVYQCSNGHSVCSKCVVKLKNCPTCAVPYPGGDGQGIRNRVVEEIISTVRFNCTWKEQGCDRQGLTGQQLTEHEDQCSFNPNPVKLCALLFWNNCEYEVGREFLRNASLDLPAGLEEHLRVKHYANCKSPILVAVRSGTVFTRHYSRNTVESWALKEGNHYTHSTLFRFVDNASGDPVGLFIVSVWIHDLKVSWFIVRVTDQQKSCSVRVKFTLKSCVTSEEDGDLNYETSWDGQIIGLREFYKLKYAEAGARDRIKFSMPLVLIREQYLNVEGLDLCVHCYSSRQQAAAGDSSSRDKK